VSCVVSDSACLIGLERVGRLDLLPAVFDELFAPPAVVREFGSQPAWLRVKAPRDLACVTALQLLAGDGEAEAIALAKEMNCELVLDDLRARRLAQKQGLRCVGLLGVLLRAKRTGRLPAVRPAIESLRRARFFISDSLIAEALRLAGE
jgi:predicted nucleic acid-binding protein